MRNCYAILLFSAIFFTSSLRAQRIDYDHSSNWFWGLNLGATWQSTDVDSKTDAGYGFTIGRSFNYNYGKRISFDLRGRYLRGFWYGQDYKASYLNQTYASSDPLKIYQDSLGFTVHNFQTGVHRLSLELVLHANGMAERTGWDPYIFGGIGYTWYQTFGDLKNQEVATLPIYGYDQSQLDGTKLMTEPYLNDLLDGIYETPLVGSNQSTYTLAVMPSLGFGIGRQLGSRVTFGLEHKTTFTGIDNFDGLENAGHQKDIYHYTSAYLQFRLKHKTYEEKEEADCDKPKVKFKSPNYTGFEVFDAAFNYEAVCKNISSSAGVAVKINGVPVTDFVFDSINQRVKGSYQLKLGTNTIEVSATNGCGTDVESITLTYRQCFPPILKPLSPNTPVIAVSQPQYTVVVRAQHNFWNQHTKMVCNGQEVSNVKWNLQDSTLSALVNLQTGANVIVLSIKNPCGNASQTLTINYTPCELPRIQVTNPTETNFATTNPMFNLSAIVSNVSNFQNVQVTMNGSLLSNVLSNTTTGTVQTANRLQLGKNTFIISASNACGTAYDTIFVNYTQCLPAIIKLFAPTYDGEKVFSKAYTLSGNIKHVTQQGVAISVNGNILSGVVFNATTGAFSINTNLNEGLNTIIINGTNDCGSTIDTVQVTYQSCLPPTLNITSPATGTLVSSANQVIVATTSNINYTGILVTLNGQQVNNLSFSSNQLTVPVQLIQGQNSIVVKVSNSCGEQTKTISLTYQPCNPPTLQLVQPASTVYQTNSSSFVYKATVSNVLASGIQLALNGVPVNNISVQNGSVTANLELVAGNNTVDLKVVNACGEQAQSVQINYQACLPPVLQLLNPTDGYTSDKNTLPFKLSVQNPPSNNQGISITLNGQVVMFNNENGILLTQLNLVSGINTVVVTVTNGCGTTTKTYTFNYSNCQKSEIKLINPEKETLTTTEALLTMKALISNQTDKSQITITQNSTPVIFTFNEQTGETTADLRFSKGLNTVVITSKNKCGETTKSVKITYNPSNNSTKPNSDPTTPTPPTNPTRGSGKP